VSHSVKIIMVVGVIITEFEAKKKWCRRTYGLKDLFHSVKKRTEQKTRMGFYSAVQI